MADMDDIGFAIEIDTAKAVKNISQLNREFDTLKTKLNFTKYNKSFQSSIALFRKNFQKNAEIKKAQDELARQNELKIRQKELQSFSSYNIKSTYKPDGVEFQSSYRDIAKKHLGIEPLTNISMFDIEEFNKEIKKTCDAIKKVSEINHTLNKVGKSYEVSSNINLKNKDISSLNFNIQDSYKNIGKKLLGIQPLVNVSNFNAKEFEEEIQKTTKAIKDIDRINKALNKFGKSYGINSSINLGNGGFVSPSFDVRNEYLNYAKKHLGIEPLGSSSYINKDYQEPKISHDDSIVKAEKLRNQLRKIEMETSRIKVEVSDTNKSLQETLVNVGALYFSIRRIGNALAKFVSASISYIENINLLGVSMGEAADDAERLSINLSKTFGLDPNNLIRYMGVFQELTTSMGLSRKEAYILSSNYTKLGLDISSLLNIDVATVFDKLQSGISGLTKPLKAVGIDITQNALKYTAALEAEKAYAAGNRELGDQLSKEPTQWSQAERQQLIYLTILRQTVDSQGDLARTLNQPAQQLRVLTNQISILKRNLGDLLLPIVNTILPVITAFLMLLNDGLQGIINTIRTLFNFHPESASDAAKKAGTDIEDVGDAAEKAEKQMKGLINGLDKFTVLSQSKPKDISNEVFDIKLPDYSNSIDKIQSSAKAIYDTFKGLAPVISGLTMALIGFAAVKLWTSLSDLASKVLGGIKAQSLSLSNVIATGLVIGVVSLIGSWDKLSTTTKVLATTFMGLIAVYELVVYWKKADSFITNILNKYNAGFTRQIKANTVATMHWASALSVGAMTVATLSVSMYGLVNSWGDMSVGARVAGVIGVITTAIFGLASALAALKGQYGKAMLYGLGASVGGIATAISTAKAPKQYAKGGLPAKGDLFIANETSPELVGSIGGKSNAVANNDMITSAIEEAAYRGISSALNEYSGNKSTNIQISLDGNSLNSNELARAIAPALRAKIRNTGGIL